MTPFERENVRKRYQQFQAMPAEKKEEMRKKWREYRNSPPEKRQLLREQHPEIYGTEELEN
jgi:hypothetical protein